MCRDKDCLERRDQAGVAAIEKGALRIGHRIRTSHEGNTDVWILWYHARCIFNTFTRARKTTRIIQSSDDLEGFDELRPEDKELLRRIIAGSEKDLRSAQFGTGVSEPRNKRGAEDPAFVVAKRRREEEKKQNQIELKKGNRCWTFPYVRAVNEKGEPKREISKKPELGMIVSEEENGYFRIQFESQEHETERLEMLNKKRYRKISGWLRYPRVFEGQIQKVEPTRIQKNRPPPKLCSCKLQDWGHLCECSGITCSRGSTSKIWGVGQ